MKKATIILIVGLVISFTAKAQNSSDKSFASALNKIINDYPNDFNNLKGKKISETAIDTVWESREKIPGYINASIKYFATITSWVTTFITTADSVEAINKYNEISEKIFKVGFDCGLLFEDNSPKDESDLKSTELAVIRVSPGKDEKFSGMLLHLRVTSASVLSKEYEVTLEIEESLGYKLLH